MKEERDVFGDEDGAGRDGDEDVIEAFDELPASGIAVGERSGKNSSSGNSDAFAMLPFGELGALLAIVTLSRCFLLVSFGFIVWYQSNNHSHDSFLQVLTLTERDTISR